MREYKGTWMLDLPDLIRVNQLVRSRIDFAGFESWFVSLSPAQRVSLAYQLCEFAHQAGVSNSVVEEALTVSGLPQNHPVVQQLRAFRSNGYPDWEGLHDFLTNADDLRLAVAFRFYVALFGTAEGKVYRGEAKEWCNHWWHRDLLDERVVRAILSDPEFYRTSMKDDDPIKNDRT